MTLILPLIYHRKTTNWSITKKDIVKIFLSQWILYHWWVSLKVELVSFHAHFFNTVQASRSVCFVNLGKTQIRRGNFLHQTWHGKKSKQNTIDLWTKTKLGKKESFKSFTVLLRTELTCTIKSNRTSWAAGASLRDSSKGQYRI